MKSLVKIMLIVSVMITGLMAPLSINVSNLISQESQNQLVQELSEPVLSVNIAHAAGKIKTGKCTGVAVFDRDCYIDAMLWLYELIIYDLTQVAAAIMGLFLDWVLLHSISSQSYKGGMIEAGWEILRDFTNILFVFALLIIAFKMVLGKQSQGSKINLIKTILIALVINFSLFMTYAMIDASNIFAHTFYNKIETTGDIAIGSPGENATEQENQTFNDLTKFFAEFNEQDFKSPSIAIIGSLNPQKIIAGLPPGAGILEAFIAVTAAGIFNIILIGLFFSVGMIFIGRTVGLMLLGIMAPLAFATVALGKIETKWIGFSNWWKDLLKLSFSAPIFLFLMYLTITFATNTGFLASIQNADTSTTLSRIFAVTLPFALIVVLLTVSKKITESLSGEIGGVVVDYAKKTIGGTVAAASVVATGGAALAARGGGATLTALGKKGGAIQGMGARLTKAGRIAGSMKGIDVSKIPGFAGAKTDFSNALTSASLGSRYRKLRDPQTRVFNDARNDAQEWENERQAILNDRRIRRDEDVRKKETELRKAQEAAANPATRAAADTDIKNKKAEQKARNKGQLQWVDASGNTQNIQEERDLQSANQGLQRAILSGNTQNIQLAQQQVKQAEKQVKQAKENIKTAVESAEKDHPNAKLEKARKDLESAKTEITKASAENLRSIADQIRGGRKRARDRSFSKHRSRAGTRTDGTLDSAATSLDGDKDGDKSKKKSK